MHPLVAWNDFHSADLVGWVWVNAAVPHLECGFGADSFTAAAAFALKVAAAADAAAHHPDIAIRYERFARVSLTTHDSGGVTQLDLDLAVEINRLAAAAGVVIGADVPRSASPAPGANYAGFQVGRPRSYDQGMAHTSSELPTTDSGIPIEKLYTSEHLGDWNPADQLGAPGQPPFTRGVYPSMYTGRLWTMRQYSGFGSAEQTNERFKFLLNAGQTGLSCAFDLPTQMGYDSDAARAEGEVGKVGVAIDSMADMRLLLADIPLDKVSTSMTINSTAAILLLMYELVAEEQGVQADQISGTIQNDLLKEYIARGTYVYPPRPSMRIITDIFEYCSKHVPSWNTISISGYHIREAGSTAVQEIAFTLSNAIAYVQAAIDAGLDVDAFAPRLSFFWNGHNNFFEEVAKFRASRRMWHKIMTGRFGATNPKSAMLRFHTQTGGSTLTAQQPINNVVRVAIQSMAAVLGGTQSLHTNGYDEALSLPTEEAARIALRTQQILGYESGVVDTVDPLAGSYFVEALTDEVEKMTWEYIEKIEEMGGAVSAIESGYQMDEIEQAAYEYTKSIDDDERVVVGVNKFTIDDEPEPEVFPVDPELERGQIERTSAYKANRETAAVESALAAVKATAGSGDNVLYSMKDALRADCTLGEISDALREVFGVYQP